MLFSNKKSMNIHLILKIKFLFSQLLKIIIVIFVLNIGLAAAISSKTNKQIEGTLPYFLFDGNIKVTNSYGFLVIKVPDDTSNDGYSYYGPGRDLTRYPNVKQNNSSRIKPVMVPQGTKFLDIKTMVPLINNDNFPKILFSDLNNFVDDDGDEITFSPGNNSGAISSQWRGDISHNSNLFTREIKEKPNQELKPCINYRLDMSYNASLKLTTLGFPGTQDYAYSRSVGNTAPYYIRVKSEDIRACYVGSHTVTSASWPGSTRWLQNSAAYKIHDGTANFPSTAADGLNMVVYLDNISVRDFISANGGTVYPISGDRSISISLSTTISPYPFNESEAVSMVFKGPSSIRSAFIPTTFEFYSDRSHTKVIYSFKLERWYFIEDGGHIYTFDQANSYCRNFGYRLASLSDLATANYQNWSGGVPGNGNHIYMQLSYKNDDGNWVGGLFSEWGGNIVPRANANTRAWSSVVGRNNNYHYVLAYKDERNNDVISELKNDKKAGIICVSP